MSPEAILVIGKAVGWIGIPLAWACWEVWRLRPGQEDDTEAVPAPEAGNEASDRDTHTPTG